MSRYPGTDAYDTSPDGTPERVVSVNGKGDWYFATEPFFVHPPRPNNLTVTWKASGPQPDLFRNHTEAYWKDFYQEFPGLKTAASSGPGKESKAWSAVLQGPGWVGLVAVGLAVVL